MTRIPISSSPQVLGNRASARKMGAPCSIAHTGKGTQRVPLRVISRRNTVGKAYRNSFAYYQISEDGRRQGAALTIQIGEKDRQACRENWGRA